MVDDSLPFSGSITVDASDASRLIKYPVHTDVTVNILQCIEWGKLSQYQRMLLLSESERLQWYVWLSIPKRVTLDYDILHYHPSAPYHSQTSSRFPERTQDEDEPTPYVDDEELH